MDAHESKHQGLINFKVATADVKSESATAKYLCKGASILCPVIFCITFNGTLLEFRLKQAIA